MLQKRHLLLLAVLSLLFLWGCSQKESSPEVVGTVEANAAYLELFGSPPEVKRGIAYARVAYLPYEDDSTRIEAVPIYLMEENNHLQKILDRLVSGELIVPPGSSLYQPLARLSAVEVSAPENGTVTLAITPKHALSGDDLKAIRTTLVQTALQDPGIKHVKIFMDGNPLGPMPEQGYSLPSGINVQVAPPEALIIAGMWERGEVDLSEIYIDFNRPVTVTSFRLSDASGGKIEGEYFTSAFSMAVVVHPEQPSRFKPGILLQAEWAVSDALGRTNKGTTRLPLVRYEH